MKMKCINFGGCYGYDLTEAFADFMQYRCLFVEERTSFLPIARFAFEYISFLKNDYDHSIEYQEKENIKLVKYLIRYYNKHQAPRKIVLVEETLVNLKFK